MRRTVAAFGLVVVAAASVAVGVSARGSGNEDGSHLATAVVTPVQEVPRSPAPAEPRYLAADALQPQIPIYASPDAAEPMWHLPNPTHEGFPLVFYVERRVDDRLLARLPMRPNGARAWIDDEMVQVRDVPHRVDVDLSERTLTVLRGEEVVWETLVAIGAPETPTPEGQFYVDISLPDPGAPYGAHLVSIAGYSDVQINFGGGIGQIAAHGWSDPSVVGHAVSNGCLRMSNEAIVRMAELTPTGTPLRIHA